MRLNLSLSDNMFKYTFIITVLFYMEPLVSANRGESKRGHGVY